MQSISSINMSSALQSLLQTQSATGSNGVEANALGAGGNADSTSFKNILLDSIQEVNAMQQDASQAGRRPCHGR